MGRAEGEKACEKVTKKEQNAAKDDTVTYETNFLETTTDRCEIYD